MAQQIGFNMNTAPQHSAQAQEILLACAQAATAIAEANTALAKAVEQIARALESQPISLLDASVNFKSENDIDGSGYDKDFEPGDDCDQ